LMDPPKGRMLAFPHLETGHSLLQLPNYGKVCLPS